MRRSLLAFTLPLLAGTVCAQDVPDDFLIQGDDIPVVLTTTRLKQPRAEVPASVTVIEAEQIRSWGARTIPELLRFVPGMVLGHSQSENSDTVVYHASVQNFMRRMQVQVDGRAVYKAAIAQVGWDDIPIALEDIQRIEITRGPSSATYGANAFMAVINIISKAPEDTLGTRLRYRGGNQSVQDALISHSAMTGSGSYRLTGAYYADDGFDGEFAEDGDDQWNDDNRQQFMSGVYQTSLTDRTHWQLRAALNNSHADIGNKDPGLWQKRDTDSVFVQSNLEFDFSANHRSQLQVYWQREERAQRQYECVDTILLDPALFDLYRLNPQGTLALIANPFDSSVLNTSAEAALYNQVLSNAGFPDMTLLGINLDDETCGTVPTNIVDQRVDIEWQDTVIWNDTLRTVSGISYRHDQADSESLFKGQRSNNLVRLFGNVEWRLQPWLLLNAGAMYEQEDINEDAFSPRLALNWLLSPQQSVRAVFSQAVRSPDMLEQQPAWTLTAYNLRSPSTGLTGAASNYLELTEGTYFLSHIAADRGLDQERITSIELGYYHLLPQWRAELDIKLYRDELRDLTSGSLNFETPDVTSDDRMDIQGAEMQLKWQPHHSDWLWLTMAYTDVEATRLSETRISPEKTLTASWHHRGEGWNATLSYLWLDSYANGENLYQRSELYVRKDWQVGRYQFWTGVFWQHQFAQEALGHYTQRYSTPNLYYLQAGLEF
ncbi:TonB-dependent receptor plug domain-containing protein [Venatoribacter cucullus]|uniref:TonB-dependent receptor plug domain-containing protein n=1 Tax=Venatoribacter cucullus TaxID=2661630 RepID=A0A9X7YNX5_9GAMM|nr:TonB-dependent receptor [Venatoribacter cucullus]QQD23472.1 TonB-dependent receptor plug domain-containing protein [Venatoribacter cucullus]